MCLRYAIQQVAYKPEFVSHDGVMEKRCVRATSAPPQGPRWAEPPRSTALSAVRPETRGPRDASCRGRHVAMLPHSKAQLSHFNIKKECIMYVLWFSKIPCAFP